MGQRRWGASAWLEVSAGGPRTVDREVHEELRALLVEAAEGGAGKGCPKWLEETLGEEHVQVPLEGDDDHALQCGKLLGGRRLVVHLHELR